MDDGARRLMDLYPRVFFACHERHVRDPRTRRLVSEHQASILAHLDEIHPMSLTGLAKHMGVTAGTMSVAVQRLERMGCIRRRRDKADSRRTLLTLTAAGARLRDAQSVLAPHRVEAMLARLMPGEQQQALDGLALLARAADDLARADPPRRFRGRRPQRSTP
jgi:DNA-binding MarR family transcriptional regulator